MSSSPWYSGISELFQKRFGKYLINRYLGTFLENHEIFLDQMSATSGAEGSSGSSISLHHVALNTRNLNAALESSELPVEFVDGYIEELSVHVPYQRMLSENCFFSIDGLTITLQVRQREHPSQISASIFHSMCESFSSLDLAEDCLKNAEPDPEVVESLADQDAVPGIKLLAQAIDSIINRVQLKLTNTTVRLEYVPTVEARGLALEIHIGLLMYSGNPNPAESGQSDSFKSTLKRLFLEKIAFYTDEFSFEKKSSPNKEDTQTESDTQSEDETDPAASSDKPRSRQASQSIDHDPPLKFAEIVGRNEIVIRFAQTTTLGLPRSVEAIDVHLGSLLIHLYPHQFHTLIEILSAITVSSRDDDKAPLTSRREVRFTTDLENLLQENMMESKSQSIVGAHFMSESGTNSMASSSEFHSMTGSNSETKRTHHRSGPHQEVPVPRIVIKVSNVIGALLEKDELLFQLGGEITKALALRKMRAQVLNFFSANFSTATWDQDRLDILGLELTKACTQSHVALVGYPLVVRYEEGVAMTSASRNKFNMFLSLDINRLAIHENLYRCGSSEVESIPIIKFMQKPSNATSAYDIPESDVRFVMKDLKEKKVIKRNIPVQHSVIDLKLNPCHVDFEPGFSDRIYILFSYAEFDSNCLKAPSNPTKSSASYLELNFALEKVILDFHVPKVDRRKPDEIPNYVEAFWSRKIHPELYQIELADLSLVIATTVPPILQPLDITMSSSKIDIRCQPHPEDVPISLIQIKQSQSGKQKKINLSEYACYIHVSVNLDDSQKLFGKYSSEGRRKPTDAEGFESAGSFKVSDTGKVTGDNDSTSNIFQKQKEYIEEALLLGQSRHNILVDLKLEDISVILPSKRIYELIYNRLGNEMILWQPEIFKVQEFLFHQPLFDPLQNPDHGFSTCFSGTKPSLDWQSKDDGQRPYVSFPRDNSATLEIHMDVCVLLSISKAQAVIIAPKSDNGSDPDSNMTLVANVDQFQLTAITGLEREPETVLLGLSLGDGCIKFGLIPKSMELNQIHFNSSPSPNLDVLLKRTGFSERAWSESLNSSRIMKLTAKILFDAKANLKTINLAFDFMELNAIIRSLVDSPVWLTWLGEFFTVVEFPVDGYLPPAILTEMQFDVRKSSVELIPKVHPARLAFTLGKARVACNLLDTGHDVNIGINLEDVCLFLARDSVDPIANSVCITDLDYLDLEIHLREEESINETGGVVLTPYLDVSAACNLIRIRTCSDTILILTEMFSRLLNEGPIPKKFDPQENPSFRQGGEATLIKFEVAENVVPDIEEAMQELQATERELKAKEQEENNRWKAQEMGGAQLFFFPNEGQIPKASSSSSQSTPKFQVKYNKNEEVTLPETLGMSESFYQSPSSAHNLSFNESSEEFCVLDHEVGIGIMPKNGEPAARNLDNDGVVVRENYFAIPQKTVDYLKTPKGFPKFKSRFTVKKLSLVWQIFGGHDFSADKGLLVDTKSKVVKDPEATTTETKSGPKRSSSSRSSGSANPARQHEEHLKLRGGPGRDSDKCLELAILRIQFVHEMYPEHCREVSRQVLVIPILEIRDRMAASDINKLLHLYSSRSRPRQTSSNMMSIRCVHIRPSVDDPTIESNINLFVQPIRLNIDQDTLFFLIDFFTTLAKEQKVTPHPNESTVVQYNAGVEAFEVREMAQEVFEDANSTAESTPDRQLSDCEEHIPAGTPLEAPPRPARNRMEQKDIFIRSFVFAPDLPIRVDYSAKYLDLTQGALTGLLSGLASLNNSELSLKGVSYQSGISGLEKLLTLLISDWLADIKHNQIPRLLGGVGPMHSIIQLGQGILDLIFMPIEQYQKDGRILRGLQKGANSFTSLTAMSVLDMTNKLLGLIKFAAEMAFDIMSPEGSVIQGKISHPGFPRRNVAHLSRPADFREGMINALTVVREGFDETARALSEVAISEHRRRGLGGAVGGVLRQMPSTIMRPVIMATAATSNVLEGVQSQVAPDIRREEEEKWRKVDPNK
ncbi:hypothetical protein TCAL_14969 [Tigriopus californicus]|uniref:Autophagy-related protein 2 n=1 Tax=Tigriopus californicus TaxID=6832 RepID=A0A553N6R1_TIGCA|nr:autophagy-related protein 2 homolog B-like [Tigriopus californicus]TRY61083.1 hypothetical protein TCAL_14969 [Tigriopus californicus]